MYAYIGRRVVQGFITVLIITVFCFILTRLSADPLAQYATNPNMSAADRAALRERLGLNAPMPVQYFRWLSLAARGELGISFF